MLVQMSKAPAPFCKRITFNFKNGIENAPTSFYYPTSELRDVFYGDCDSQVNLDSLQLSAARTELRIWTHASNAFDSLQIVVSADEQGVNLLRIYRSDAAKRYRHA